MFRIRLGGRLLPCLPHAHGGFVARAAVKGEVCQSFSLFQVSRRLSVRAIFAISGCVPGKPVFDTPKPEQLIRRILDIATDEGDLVLDAFLGSGSTVSAAHKMRRQYIGIESGSHAVEYALKRLQLVVDGEDGGISHDVGWKGGGGFDFCKKIK